MYCSSCGVAVAQGRSYCNYCGAKVSSGDSVTESSEVKPGLLVSAMVGLFILGLVAITMLMGMMKSILDLPVERVLAITLIPFLLLLLIEGVLIRLLLRRTKPPQEASDRTFYRGQVTSELDAAHARALPEPLPSVTENTTRTLVHNERTSK